VSNYLLVYDRARGQLLVEQEFSDRAAALEERFRLEREHVHHRNIEIVVLGADSAEAIRRSHAAISGPWPSWRVTWLTPFPGASCGGRPGTAPP
jgi:hypothetical protein